MPIFESLTGEAAIDAYLALLAERPELAGRRDDLVIVDDRSELVHHVAESGDAIGLVLRSIFGLVVIDLVESYGVRFPYIRLVAPFPVVDVAGVVCLAVADETDGAEPSVVLVESFRHATGQAHLELPRGCVGGQEAAADAAIRELQEETGYQSDQPEVLATTLTDTGLTANNVAFVRLRVTGRVEAEPEVTESIRSVQMIPLDRLRRMVRSGEVTDGFTIQALGLLAAMGGDS
ncbi:MAG: NUDIX hydrolase [Actinomycetota bacterium]